MNARRGAAALVAAVLAASPAAAQDKVPAGEAIAAWKAICLDTAPGFATAEAAALGAGITNVASTGTMYHPSGTLSARIKDFTYGDGTVVRRCSVVFEAPDNAASLAAIEAALAGHAGAFRSEGSAERAGTRDVWRWEAEMGAERGKAIFAGYSAEEPFAVILLEFLK